MFKLINPEKIILDEIGDKRFIQKDIAKTYHLVLLQGLEVDWSKINKAIVKRWSRTGLDRIKKLALSGKCFD